jgi:diaminopimelate epimerase
MTTGVPFLKGHGTENDFILLPDRDGTLSVSEAQVRALCDRHAGIGADGVIRIAPVASGGFFMDYRNADGSVAEMCGNGARLFARYLVDAGWQPTGTFSFATGGGPRTADLGAEGDVSIGMGQVVVGGESKAVLPAGTFPGVSVDVGNPHLVCFVKQDSELQALDLTSAPEFDASVFPEGVNIEFVVVLAADRVRMRVYERGVGETRSCGTGTVAVAAAFRAAGGRSARSVTVEVPGGVVQVDLSDEGATLTGPAVIVGSGTIDPGFWARNA